MTHYSHTQIGTMILAVFGLALLVMLVIYLTVPAPPQMFVAAAILALTAFLFSRLTVEIRDSRLVCYFGPGLIRRSFKLDAITGCARVRNSWLDGWGVRLTSHGWMFNIAGLDAVELTLADGRRFRIGTDEPDRLCTAIRTVQSLRFRSS